MSEKTDILEKIIILALVWPSDKSSVLPLKQYHAHQWVSLDITGFVELGEDKRINVTPPCLARVHARAYLSVFVFLVL